MMLTSSAILSVTSGETERWIQQCSGERSETTGGEINACIDRYN